MRSSPDYQAVKKEVQRLHRSFSINSPPVNPVAIAKGLGVGVQFAKFSGDYQNVSGFFDPEENLIIVNQDEYPLRQTFTIAHELGHALLHKDWVKSDDYRIFWRDDDTDKGEVHEKEANAFAAHLLVPRKFLDSVYDELSVEDLSRLFAVSVPVIKNRLHYEYGI